MHCMQALLLRHLLLQIALGNCSSEGGPHHLVSDPSNYLFLHSTCCYHHFIVVTVLNYWARL